MATLNPYWPKPIHDIDLYTLARTIYGEARGESYNGQIAVGQVILNRFKKQKKSYGLTIADVCLKPRQFSCWNSNDPNSAKLRGLIDLRDDTYQLAYSAALDAIMRHEEGVEHTEGSLHYINPKVAQPVWIKGKTPVYMVGNHHFYNNID